MKNHLFPFFKSSLRSSSVLAASITMMLGSQAANGAALYWDTDATTAGFGTASGTWGTDTFWNTDAAGGAGTFSSATATTDTTHFGNGATGLGAGTIAVGTVSSGNITFASGSGDIALTGGTITLVAAATMTADNATDSISSVLAGAATSLTKSGTGTLTLSGANTYGGSTNVGAGTLVLSGNQTVTATNGFNVGNVAASTGTLNISNGTFTSGAFYVGNGSTAIGIVNQTGGTLTLSATQNQLLLGNGTGNGTYNLSAGSLTTSTSTNRGIILGTNAAGTSTFNLSGTGILNASNALLMVGRSDSAANNTTNLFNQTGGTATVGTLTIGGGNSGLNSTFTVTGGTFSTTNFTLLGAGSTGVVTMNIGSIGVVTLPAFPTARGAGTTATINFDGGTLKNAAASATYMGGLTSAFIKTGGAQFDTTAGAITITQALLTHATALNGGLTKIGTNTLTMTGANTYTGVTTLSTGTINLGIAEIAGTSGPLGNSSASNPGSIVLNGGTLQYSPSNNNDYSGRFSTAVNQVYNVDTNGQTVTWATALTSNGGTLIKSGAGTITLTAANTYTGNTLINVGALSIGQTASLPGFNTNGRFSVALNAILGVRNAVSDGDIATMLGTTNFTAGSSIGFDTSTGNRTFAANLGDTTQGALGLAKLGPNTLTLTGTNTYTGVTTLSAGTINLGIAEIAGTSGPLGNSAASNPGSIVLNGGTLQYSPSNNNDYSGRFSTAVNQGYNVNTNGQTVTWATALTSNGGTLIKSGAGTITLTAANTYTGNTTLSGTGTLRITNAANTTPGVFVIGAGTTLNLASFSNYGVASAMGSRLATSETNGGNSATTGIGLHFQGGTLQYTGSTAQSTNRQIRLLNSATNTIDASGTGSGTLSFTHTGANINLFETVGTRSLNLTGSNTGANTFAIGLTNQGTNATSLTKSGVGTWVLTGANTYTGNTTVSVGTLSLSSPYLADASTLTIATGATLNLNYTGTDIVASLDLGGSVKTTGTFDSTNSGGLITGNGKIQVGAATANFSTWATANGINGEPATGDFDKDGLSNLVEYALGLNPTTSSVPAGTFIGGVLSFTKGSEAFANGDLTYEIETSTTLATWSVVVANNAAQSTMTYTLPTGLPKEFARLKVTQIP